MIHESNLFFNLLDYPSIPFELETESYKCINPNNCYLDYKHFKKFHVSDSIKNWLEKNIIPVLGDCLPSYDFSVQKILKSYADRPPHTDGYGNLLLYYIINNGGNCVSTNWYQEEGFPLMRSPNLKTYKSFEKLTKVFNTVLPIKKWLLLESNILHNLSNMQSDRIGLAIRIFR